MTGISVAGADPLARQLIVMGLPGVADGSIPSLLRGVVSPPTTAVTGPRGQLPVTRGPQTESRKSWRTSYRL
jgi:hypothetical protein